MPIALEQRWKASVGDVAVGSIDCEPYLDDGELVSTLDSVVEETSSDLSFANQAVSTAALSILGRTVAIGKAIQFKYSGQLVANTPYTVTVTFTTDSTPARTKVVDQLIDVTS